LVSSSRSSTAPKSEKYCPWGGQQTIGSWSEVSVNTTTNCPNSSPTPAQARPLAVEIAPPPCRGASALLPAPQSYPQPAANRLRRQRKSSRTLSSRSTRSSCRLPPRPRWPASHRSTARSPPGSHSSHIGGNWTDPVDPCRSCARQTSRRCNYAIATNPPARVCSSPYCLNREG
jgi:hypothetical protein